MQYPQKQQAAWVENQQRPMTGEGFVEVSYKVADAALEVTDMDCVKLDWAQGAEIAEDVERTVVPYGTLERDRWRLNGSKKALPDADVGYAGYISAAVCNQSGAFAEPPVLTLHLNTVDRLSGITITWDETDGEHATAFDVRLYTGGALRQTVSVTDNTEVRSVVRFAMDATAADDFDTMTVRIKKWSCPWRRARVAKLFFGLQKVYTKRELLNFSCTESIDPLSVELPKYELQFEVDNRDGAFSPLNPQGLTPYMMERQELKTRYGFRLEDGVEWIDGGVYYLSEWSAPENGLSASFKARDLLGFLNETYYKDTVELSDGKLKARSLYSLAETVLTEADLPRDKNGNLPWFIHPSLETMTTTAPLPLCSMAECLQLIANAAGCAIYFDRKGWLRIAPLLTLSNNTHERIGINADNSYTKAEITLTKPVKRVDVSVYDYVVEEVKDLYSETLWLDTEEQTFLIAYSDTATGVTLNKPMGVTVTKQTYYANYCELGLRAVTAGNYTVTVSGKPLKAVEKTHQVNGSGTGEVQTLKNQLITDSDRAQTIGEAFLENAILRRRLSAEWRADPRMDVGDFVMVDDSPMRVLSSNLSFSGAFKGKFEGVVME